MLNEDWLRFLALTSTAFALREKYPHVPNTSANRVAIVEELQQIMGRTNIMQSLRSWNDLVHFVDIKRIPNAYFYLLTLDVNTRKLDAEVFSKDEAVKAQYAYDKAEKDTERNQDTNVVLVSVDDLDGLHKAYPNYYVDTKGRRLIWKRLPKFARRRLRCWLTKPPPCNPSWIALRKTRPADADFETTSWDEKC